METLVLFSMPVACNNRYGWLVRPEMLVLTLVVLELPDPAASSTVTLPSVDHSQTPIARASRLSCEAVTVSLAAVVSPVVSSENHKLTVTPSAALPLVTVYSYPLV